MNIVKIDIIAHDRASAVFTKVGKSADLASTKLGKIGARAQAVGSKMTHAVTLPVVAVGAESVVMATKFEASMKKVQTQAGASAKDVRTLSKQVIQLGTYAEQSPQELADALFHLKSVGMDNVDAMRALKTASDLAAVGGADLEDTTNALAGAWRTGIKGAKSFSEAASTVNAIIGAGNMKMSDLTEALSSGILPAAKTFGLSFKQVGAAIALFTDEGVPASVAANRLRTGIQVLGAGSAHADDVLSDLGITTRDLAKKMRSGGIIAAIELLQKKLDASGMSAVNQSRLISHAFGGSKSAATIMSLVNNLDVLKKKQDQVNSSTGRYAMAVAEQRKTAQAQFALLKSSVEVLGVKIGNALLPHLVDVSKALNSMVGDFGKLPSPVKHAIGDFALLAAAVGPTVLVVGKAITGVNNLKIALKGMSLAGKLTSGAMAGIGIAVSAALLIWEHYKEQQAKIKQDVDDLTASLDKNTGSITKNTRQLAAKKLVDSGMATTAQNLGLDLKDVTSAMLNQGNAAGSLRKYLNDVIKAHVTYRTVTENGQKNTIKGLDAQGKAAAKLLQYLGLSNKELTQAQKKAQQYREANDKGAGAVKNMADAQQKLKNATFGVTAALARNGKTLNKHTAAGKDNWKALKDLVSGENSYLKASKKAGVSTVEMTSREKAAHDAIVKAAVSMGMSKTAAEKYAKSLLKIPKNVHTKVHNNASAASKAVESYHKKLSEIPKGIYTKVQVKLQGQNALNKLNALEHSGYASGGSPKPGMAWVGEKGPELVQFRGGERVFSHADSKQIAGASRGKFAGYAAGTGMAGSPAPSNASGLNKAVTDLTKAVVNPWAKARSWLVKPAKDMVDGLDRGMKTQTPQALKATTSLTNQVRNHYKPAKSWLISPGKETVHGYRSGINTATPSAVSAAKTTGQKTRNVFNGSKTWLRNDGKSLITGLRQGAQSESSHLISSVKGIGSALVKAVKKFFGIHSPSKVFQEIGGHLIGGLVKGMLNSNPKNVMHTVFGGYGKEAGQALQWMLDHHKISYSELAQIPPDIFSKLGFGGSFGGGMTFARAQVGKPYIWGGVGPRGYDCSGFMSAIENVIQGKNPYQRRFATASFSGGPRQMAGFVRNLPSPFMIGVRPGSHTAGTLLGTNVESSGSIGPHVGRSARGYNNSMFPLHYGFAGKLGGSGGKRNPVGADKEGKGFAKGGVTRPRQWALVGEKGPELVKFRDPARIYNNRQSQRMMSNTGSAGGTVIHVHVAASPFTTPADNGRAVVKAVREYQKSTGGQPIQIKVSG